MSDKEFIGYLIGGLISLAALFKIGLNAYVKSVTEPKQEQLEQQLKAEREKSEKQREHYEAFLNLSAETNLQIQQLTQELKHNSEINQIKISNLDKKVDDNFLSVDGRLIKVEKIVFENNIN